MGTYIVVFSLTTGVVIEPDQMTLKTGTTDIKIRLMATEDSVLNIKPFGYMIEMRMDAENMHLAESSAYSVLDFFLSCLSYCSVMPIFGPRKQLIYEVSPDITSRPFRQYFYDFIAPAAEEKVDANVLARLSERIFQSVQDNGNFARAFRWYRKGMLEDDQVDQFLFFWQGLETINKTVADKLGVSTNTTITIQRTCLLCNNEYDEEITTKGGIEALYEYFGIEKAIKIRINRIRNGTSHGYASMHDLWRESLDLLPTMAMLLHGAITLCLDMKPEPNKLFKTVAPIKVGECLYLDANLMSVDINQLGVNGYYPFFVHETKQIIQDNGEISNKSSFRPVLSCPYQGTGFGVSGRNVNVALHETK